MSSFNNSLEEKHYYETQVSEDEFLTWYKQQHFPTHDVPSVTVDIVLFCYNREEDDLKVLLIKRNTHPFQYSWALPGGFVQQHVSTADSCIRQTFAETGVSITKNNIEQLHTFSTPGRDPRGWVITVSYLAFIGEEPLTAGQKTSDASWFSVKRSVNLLTLSNSKKAQIKLNLLNGESLGRDSLAFDHADIVTKAFNRVCNKMYHEPQVLRVLGESFTITQARKLYAKFLGIDYQEIDHSNFKKALLPYLDEVGQKAIGVGRPSKIYQLKTRQ
ncbi:DNA mismatch repair protein MutT [Vagococcus penaei]|uniref:DNA mismatch repair protein MutT n=1 Tax=Vagococcus penaei TaxID=633807 RepID=A0A1Q2D8B3_9ENTE|nr:NUDIX domain-containing protein [Vagococcus penaei]AQP54612.1 DNA mismatch repair protein MutT [Vagococcus penaei]RSU06675.1 DNA mismatch repair protein MutT [Vagococcus penaei]